MLRAVHVINDAGVAAAALHPLRREILSELSEPESAAGLARRIGMPRQQVNYHIRKLEEQGLVELVGERRVRNCLERLVQAVGRSYVISPAALGRLAADPERIEDPSSAAYLAAVGSQMVQEVAALQREPGQPDEGSSTLTLRADIRFRSRGAQIEFSNELAEELARLVSKYHVPRASKGRLLRVLAGAYPVPSGE
jgi:DNA-binding transcriptional ArsR family regulator